ncbi:hypothetical protein R1flu_027110 [Riccia fluitans]|uniref:Uncharacterized protein n=1 Tax=Riccia fluitans TaxID=41844 RepID=A0ABD1XHX7_9MARC
MGSQAELTSSVKKDASCSVTQDVLGLLGEVHESATFCEVEVKVSVQKWKDSQPIGAGCCEFFLQFTLSLEHAVFRLAWSNSHLFRDLHLLS